GLLEASKVLVGSVEYRPLGNVAPLDFKGIEARAEVELVSAGESDGLSIQRFTIHRHFFASGEVDDLLESAQKETGEALEKMMGYSLRRSAGPVGIKSDKPLLGI